VTLVIPRSGFNQALEISTYSLIQLSGAAKPYDRGRQYVTLTYLGGVRVVPNYNLMGVAKAGLETSVRYLASELGPHIQ